MQKAQLTAHLAVREGIPCSAVDHSGRRVIDKEGYGDHFTHRLGHGKSRLVWAFFLNGRSLLSVGIGLEGHETPYLREDYASPLRINNTFSNEPGVYIEGDVGVRLEDCFYVSEDGPVMFTERAKDPWNP